MSHLCAAHLILGFGYGNIFKQIQGSAKKTSSYSFALEGEKRNDCPYQPDGLRFSRRSPVKSAHKSVDSRAKGRNSEDLQMEENNDRRKEQRLRYYWPIWFAEDVSSNLAQGQMVDISSIAAAFTCYTNDGCPYHGQHITARFSVPCYGFDDSFDMKNFTRSGHVYRVDNVNGFLRRVVLQFAEPLPFKPGEQKADGSGTEQLLEPVTA
jgi:hypothetical protein